MSDERAAFAGQITDLPVVELLRTISNGKKTGVAHFETNLGTAMVWFREGTLVDADMGRFHMGDAVRRLIATDAGSFEVEFKPVTRRRLIQESTPDLLAHTPQPAALAPTAKAEPRPKPTLPALADDPSARPRTRAAAGWKPTAGGTGRDGGAGAASPDMLRRLEGLRRAADRQPPRADVLSSTAALGARGPEQAGHAGASTGETPQAGLESLNRLAQKVSKAPRPATGPAQNEDDRVEPGPHATPATPPQPIQLETETDHEVATRALPKPSPSPDASPSAAALIAQTPPPPQPTPRKPITARPGRSRGPRPTAAIESRKAKRTSSGIPAQSEARPREQQPAEKQDANGWTFVDPTLARDADLEEDARTDQTLMRMGPLQLPQAPSKRPGGNRKPARAQPEDRQAHPTRVDPSEDMSDPLPIGTSWSAPAHVATPRSKPIDSDHNHSAGGEIGKGSRPGAGKTVVAFAPDAPSNPDPGGTMTHGFRPITDAEGPTGQVPAPGAAEVAARAIAVSSGNIGAASPGGGATGTSGGAQVGRYEVLLRIARGGMGTVYLCQVTGTGGFRRLFALKVIRDHLSRNEEYVRMLLLEARIASRLHHPNVVGIVDIGNLANQHYLVMDYVEGCTLSELLKVHRKTRPPHLIIPIVLDALTGLHAAHSLTDDDGSPLTLVHCDFSPQNMLVGTNGICRITDFGIARASNALPERSSITRGKPAYLAPEQITGRQFDHRADIFASGVVLWNALTGEQLFKGDTPEEVLDKVLNMQIPAPSTVGLRPPKKLDKVVLRALERDPARRFQCAEEMLIELRKVAIGNDLLAPSSEVAQWVADTFGAQLELRRQAAGLAPNNAAPT
ncbi:MAG: protein kinase, partial [Nannocystaceae bacterium]|nr:protein kinase [Nannocystaceae bacterium]